jgi:hypothetical protein
LPVGEYIGLKNKSASEIQGAFICDSSQWICELNNSWSKRVSFFHKEEFPSLANILMEYITPFSKARQIDTVSAAETLRECVIRQLEAVATKKTHPLICIDTQMFFTA